MDPPDHTRLRRLVSRAFTPLRVATGETRIAALVDELVRDVAERDSFDLIAEVAYPLPAIVIAEMLGAPPEDRDRFKGWSDDLTALVFGDTTSDDRHGRAATGMKSLSDYIEGLIERYRSAPEENLISELVSVHDDDDDRLSSQEVIATCALLLFGGHETTTNLIASGALALLQHPQALDDLARDGELMGTALEEILRDRKSTRLNSSH